MNRFDIKLMWCNKGKVVTYYFHTDLFTMELMRADLRARGYDVIFVFGRITDKE